MKKIGYAMFVVVVCMAQIPNGWALGQKKTRRQTKSLTQTKPQKQTAVRLSGNFDSAKGRMHPLSVLGYNIGYLDGTKAGSNTPQRFIVCFDRLAGGEDLDISGNVTVEGYFEAKKPATNPNPQLARPVGSESSTDTIFYVTKWQK